MKRAEFIHGVTRTKVIETRLLSLEKIDRIVESKDIEEALKLLNETEYSNSFKDLRYANDYEKILSNELERIYELMRDVSAKAIVVDLLALKYDYHNLKVMVKERLSNRDFSEIYISVGIVALEKLKDAYVERDFSEIPREFKEAIISVEEDFKETKDPQRIDFILDQHYFNHFYNMAKECKIELFINYARDMIDFTNIQSFIRLKKQKKALGFFKDVILDNGNIEKDHILAAYDDSLDDFVNRFQESKISESLTKGLNSYKETGRLSYYEKYMDDYLMDLNRPSIYINDGPEPIFSYILAKETEIKTLRIVLVGIVNKLSPELIRERMRELYV